MSNKDELNKIKEKVELFETEVKDKEDKIKEKEKMFKIIDTKIEDFIKQQENTTISINVGGRVFNTFLSTIVSVKDSLFYGLIAEYIKNDKPIPSFLFFDRSPKHFELILNYLRFKIFSLKRLDKNEKLEAKDEVEYYGLTESLNLGKKIDIDIEWDKVKTKTGQFSVDNTDPKKVNVHSNTCYSHFVAKTPFKDQDFQVDLEVNIQQTDNYLYIGLMNSAYNLTGNCGCCNPGNSYYIQCDGSLHINGSRTDNYQLAWNSNKILISLKVYLSDPNNKRIYFCFPEKNDLEIGPHKITQAGDFFVYGGHCNTGTGYVNILECFELTS